MPWVETNNNEVPKGRWVEVDEVAPDAPGKVAERLQAHTPGKPLEEAKPITNKILESIVNTGGEILGSYNSMRQGLMFGFRDELDSQIMPTAVNASQAQFELNNPVKKTAGEMVGGAIGGAGLAKSLVGVAPKAVNAFMQVNPIKTGMTLGSIEGGISGAGFNNDNRLQGALTGGALGGVFPALTGNAMKLYKKGYDMVFPQASKAVGEVVEGISKPNLDISIAEQSHSGAKLLRAAAATSQGGIDDVTNQFKRRLNGIHERIQGATAKALGREAEMKSLFTSGITKQSKEASELYEAAFREVMPESGNLASLMDTPAVIKAMSVAKDRALNKRIAPGGNSVQYWHLVKGALDDQIKVFKRAGNLEEAMDVIGLKNDLLRELNQVPSYSQARQLWSSKSEIEDAYELGKKFLLTSSEELEGTNFTKGEKQAYLVGVISDLRRKMEKSPEESTRLFNFMESIGFKRKLKDLIGDKADGLIDVIKKERRLAEAYQEVLGGSQTADNLAAQGLLKSDLSKYMDQITFSHDMKPDQSRKVVELLAMPASKAVEALKPKGLLDTLPGQLAVTHPLATELNKD